MENTNKINRRGTIAIVIIIALILVGGVYKTFQKSDLESSPYISASSTYAISLPMGWGVSNEFSTTTISSVWFTDLEKKTEPEASIVVSRRDRDLPLSLYIETIGGEDKYLEEVAMGIGYGVKNYQVVSTSTIIIDDQPFRYYESTYDGTGTGRQATQYLYLTLRNDGLYLIGIDVYTDKLPELKEKLMASAESFKLRNVDEIKK